MRIIPVAMMSPGADSLDKMGILLSWKFNSWLQRWARWSEQPLLSWKGKARDEGEMVVHHERFALTIQPSNKSKITCMRLKSCFFFLTRVDNWGECSGDDWQSAWICKVVLNNSCCVDISFQFNNIRVPWLKINSPEINWSVPSIENWESVLPHPLLKISWARK